MRRAQVAPACIRDRDVPVSSCDQSSRRERAHNTTVEFVRTDIPAPTCNRPEQVLLLSVQPHPERAARVSFSLLINKHPALVAGEDTRPASESVPCREERSQCATVNVDRLHAPATYEFSQEFLLMALQVPHKSDFGLDGTILYPLAKHNRPRSGLDTASVIS